MAETPIGAPGTMRGVTEDEADEAEELPTAFVAITVNVSAVPSVRLLNVAVRTLPTVTATPAEEVTVYPVIAEPPFEAGAVQVTVAEALPATAETPVGAPGTVGGVTGDDAAEGKELPTAFMARTVNVTAVPLNNPISVVVKTLPTVTWLPTDGVTLYPVIPEPPFEAGAVHETDVELIPATAETPVGAPGTVGVVIEDDAEEAEESPTAFIATTVNVRTAPLSNPLSVADKTLPTVRLAPTEGFTVYPVISKPPFIAGAVHETVAELTPATAETAVGAPGAVGRVIDDVEEGRELPIAFIATTVNVRTAPLSNPLSVAVRTLPTVNGLPVDGVTLYPVIGEPPFDAGAVHETVAELIPATAETPVGVPATIAGIIAADGEEGKELLPLFIAITVKVIDVSPSNPVSVAVRTFPTVKLVPVDEVTVYPVIAESPVEVGAIHETVAEVLPATAVTDVGTPGGDAVGVTEAEAEEDSELPAEFIATTVNVTGLPLANPVSVAVNTLPTVTGLPRDGVTLYPVIAEPPFIAGALHETVAEFIPATAETPVGASATVAGVTDAEAEEGRELPR